MSFGGLLAAGLAGGARAVGQLAYDQIGDERKRQLMQEEASVREESQKRLAEYQQRLDLDKVRQLSEGPVADATLALKNRGLRQDYDIKEEQAQVERARIAELLRSAKPGVKGAVGALTAAGDFPSATAYGKAATSGDRTLGYGGKLLDADGNVIAESESDKAQADLIRANARAISAGGRTSKVDHFDEKQWDDARKPEKDWFKVGDMGGKEVYVPQLSVAFSRVFTQLRNTPDVSPQEARTKAYDFSAGLQARAEALQRTDEGKKMSIGEAVDTVMKRMTEAAKAPSPDAPTVGSTVAAPASLVTKTGLLSPALGRKEADPADSPAGKAAARRDALRMQESDKQASQARVAAEAFAALRPDDVQGAVDLQASPLFSALTIDQKREVYRRATGR